MRWNPQTTTAAAIAAVMSLSLVSVPPTRAALLTSSNGFETYSAGPIDGHDGWTAPTLAGGSTANVISTDQGAAAGDVYAGSQALELHDKVDWGPGIINHLADAPTTAGSLSWVVKVSADATGNWFFELGTTTGHDGDAINIIGFNADNHTFLLQPSGTPLAGLPAYTPDRWYRFDLSFDTSAGARGQFSLSITDLSDNTPVYTAQNLDFKSGFTQGTGVSLITFRSSNAAVGAMDIDNVTVPEPASLSLLTVGVACGWGRRRRRA